MKKLFIGLLSICLLFSMVACNGSNNTVDTSSIPIENEEPVYEAFTWPASDIAKLLPVPKSSIGKIEWEASCGFVIYVAETTKTDYDEYVSLCEEAGFMVDYNKGDDFFYGDNVDGYSIYLRYDEGDVMFVRIDEPEEAVGTTATESDDTDDTNDTDDTDDTDNTDDISDTDDTDNTDDSMEGESSDITPEFKELMDGYESFFNEYVEFMKKYKESDNQVAMMTDMLDYMTKYSDMMAKFQEVENSELSDADSAYYLEVIGRIMKKLAEIA